MSLGMGAKTFELGMNSGCHHLYRRGAVHLAESSLTEIVIDDRRCLLMEAPHALFENRFRVIVALLKCFSIQVTDIRDQRRMTIDVVNVSL